MNRRSLTAAAAFLVFAAVAYLWAADRDRHRLRNWDMLMYIAVVLHQDEPDLAEVQRLTYDTMRALVSEGAMVGYIHDDYTTRVATDADYFARELVMYRTKPLYTRVADWLHGAGFAFDRATALPSVVGAVMLNLILFGWLLRTRGPTVALALGVVMMFGDAILLFATYSTPDLAAAPWVMLAFAAIYFRVHPAWALAAMAVAVGFRTDHAVYLGLLWVYAAYEVAERRGWRLGRRLGFAGLAALAGLALTVAGLYAVGKDVQRVWDAYEHVYVWEGFTSRFWWSVDQWIHHSIAPFLTAVAVASYAFLPAGGRRVLLVAGGLVLLRLCLIPVFEERFFLGFEWAVLAAVASGPTGES